MPVTEAQVLDALRPVEDPELHRSIVDLGMVRRIAIDGAGSAVTVALTVAGCPLRRRDHTPGRRRRSPRSTASTRVDLDFTVMTDEERAALRIKLHGDPAATAGSQPPTATPRAGPSRSPTRAARPGCC